jgi:CRISPR/Cas system CSM-associated protein Csm3 (group 7 of RAMP superfamily)
MIFIKYSIALKTSIRIGTGISSSYLDDTIVKDSNGGFFIPGSSIKGKIRSQVYRFADALGNSLHDRSTDGIGCLIFQEPCLICRIFGSPHWQGGIYFSNATLSKEYQLFIKYLNKLNDAYRLKRQSYFGVQSRTNVAINRKFRTAQPDHLFSSECFSSDLILTGEIEGEIRNLSSNNYELALLLVSMQQITHIGSDRGRGMGRCQVDINQVKLQNNILDLSMLINENTLTPGD